MYVNQWISNGSIKSFFHGLDSRYFNLEGSLNRWLFSAILVLLIKILSPYYYKLQNQRDLEVKIFAPSLNPPVEQSNVVEQSNASLPPKQLINKTDHIFVRAGSNIKVLLSNLGITAVDISLVEKACIKAHKKKITFQSGQEVVVTYSVDPQNKACKLIEMKFYCSEAEKILVKRNADNQFIANLDRITINKEVNCFSGSIGGNFFSTAKKIGVPLSAINVAVRALGYIINFQHSIKNGAKFDIVCEVFKNPEGKIVRTGNLLYVGIEVSGKVHKIYSNIDRNGKVQYYNSEGESIVRSLLQTPIDPKLMRISSRFSKSRMHPILGYSRAHMGVDFAAKCNTPVMSAGDGVVVKACYYGNYGNYVRIRHNDGCETVYAHLNKFGAQIKPGTVVKQRQVIGFVGCTGLASGYHLHHEVWIKNSPVDPQKVVAMPKTKLTGQAMRKFEQIKQQVDKLIRKNRDKNPLV